MKKMFFDPFEINLLTIKNKPETFNFDIDDSFFSSSEQDIVEKGKLAAKVELTKTENLITTKIKITGNVELTCDRSLELFDHQININQDIFFKYGENNQELDDNLFQITPDTTRLNLYKHVLDLILVNIPLKKISPKHLKNEDENISENEVIVYKSSQEEEDKTPDPRWNGLKELKDKFLK